MCGRYTISKNVRTLRERFQFTNTVNEDLFLPRYNLAPTEPAPVVVEEGGDRRLYLMLFGLIPFWAKDPKIATQCINARAETVKEKPAFRNSFKKKRCLVLADGYYEWRAEGKLKIPYYFRLKSGEPFAFAGLWDIWRSPSANDVKTFSLITTTPNQLVSTLHDRMPVILDRKDEAAWLSPEFNDVDELQKLLTGYSSELMEVHQVSRRVNRGGIDDPDLVLPSTEV